MDKIIRLKDVVLKNSSNKVILDHVTFELAEHESVYFIGHNGAGKSSLLKLLVGASNSSEGTVEVFGQKISPQMPFSHLTNMRKKIAFIHQGLHLISRKTAFENVLMGRLPHNRSWKTWLGSFSEEDTKIAEESLQVVGLLTKRDVRASQLSGGEKQKVAIARALAQRPALMLADEPTASLDPVAEKEIAVLLRSLVLKKEISLITVVHSLELMKDFSERIIVFNDGKIVFDGNHHQLNFSELRKFYEQN